MLGEIDDFLNYSQIKLIVLYRHCIKVAVHNKQKDGMKQMVQTLLHWHCSFPSDYSPNKIVIYQNTPKP